MVLLTTTVVDNALLIVAIELVGVDLAMTMAVHLVAVIVILIVVTTTTVV